jgi:hypothetical protein
MGGLAALMLTSCTSGGSPDPGAGSTDGQGTRTTTSGDPATPGPDPNLAYGLDLPAGVRLTKLGSELTVGDTARVGWQVSAKQVGVIAVTVTRLRKGSIEDFKGFVLDATTKRSTPYYVDAKVRNIGRSNLSGVDLPLYLQDTNNVLIEASSFRSVFSPCAAQPLPAKFIHGKSARVCLVFLADNRGTLEAISFRPTQSYAPILWTGRPTTAAGKPPKNS